MTGSHLDTSRRGQVRWRLRCDGGLEVLRVLHDSSYVTGGADRSGLWTNEEAAASRRRWWRRRVRRAFELDYALGIKAAMA